MHFWGFIVLICALTPASASSSYKIAPCKHFVDLDDRVFFSCDLFPFEEDLFVLSYDGAEVISVKAGDCEAAEEWQCVLQSHIPDTQEDLWRITLWNEGFVLAAESMPMIQSCSSRLFDILYIDCKIVPEEGDYAEISYDNVFIQRVTSCTDFTCQVENIIWPVETVNEDLIKISIFNSDGKMIASSHNPERRMILLGGDNLPISFSGRTVADDRVFPPSQQIWIQYPGNTVQNRHQTRAAVVLGFDQIFKFKILSHSSVKMVPSLYQAFVDDESRRFIVDRPLRGNNLLGFALPNDFVGEHKLRITASGRDKVSGEYAEIAGEIDLDISRKKTCLYLVLVYSDDNKNHVPSPSGLNWDTDFAACGASIPTFLSPSDTLFRPNATLTECANALLESARSRRNMSEYRYVVIVTNPLEKVVLAEFFDAPELPRGAYRALETLLQEFRLPIAVVRRGRAPIVGRAPPYVDVGADLEMGIVAIQSEQVELMLPFRDVAAGWAASVCALYGTARVAFAGAMFRLNAVVMARWNESGGRDPAFCQIHYGACDGESAARVWEAGCDAGMSWLIGGVRSGEEVAGLLEAEGDGRHSWLEQETPSRYELSDLEGLREYGSAAAVGLFDAGHPVVCGHVTRGPCREVKVGAELWGVLHSATRSLQSHPICPTLEYDSKERVSVFIPPRLRGEANATQVEEVVREAQRRVIERIGRGGEWVSRAGEKEWAVIEDGGSHVFRKRSAEEYRGMLVGSRICFVGDSFVREISYHFARLLAAAGQLSEEGTWNKKYGGTLNICDGIQTLFMWAPHVEELNVSLHRTPTCDLVLGGVGVHHLYDVQLSGRGSGWSTANFANDLATNIGGVVTRWLKNTNHTVPFAWLGMHDPWLDRSPMNYPHAFRSKEVKIVSGAVESVLESLHVPVIRFWNSTSRSSRQDFLPDGLHTSPEMDSLKALMLATVLLDADQ